MKRIIDVRLGLRAITRVYRGDTLIWEKQPRYKLLANSISDIETVPKGSFELSRGTEASMMGGWRQESIAHAEMTYCSRVAAHSIEGLDAAVTPEGVYPHNADCSGKIIIDNYVAGENITPALERLIDWININTCVSPTTNVAFVNGVIEIDIKTSGAAKNDRAIPLFSADKVILSEAGHGRNIHAVRAYSRDKLDISTRAGGESHKYHEVSSHSKITLAEKGTADNVQITRIGLYGTISASGALSSFDGTVRDASMTALIDAIGRLYSSSGLIVDNASNCHIRIESIPTADLIDGSDVQAQGVISTDAITQVITWTYPTLSGDTLLIVQALETDDSDLPTLHIA